MQHGNPTYKKDRDSHRAPTNVDIDELPVQEISDRKRFDGSVAAARSTSAGVGVGECDSDSFSARSRLFTTSYGHALCVPDRPPPAGRDTRSWPASTALSVSRRSPSRAPSRPSRSRW